MIRRAARPSRAATGFQAILPLRGKILNVEKARLDKMLSSQEIVTLITALGTGVGDTYDINKLRYHRIIIMTDADVDGSHIRTLLLTFFYRHFPEIIDRGYLYIAQPPLYKVRAGRKDTYLKNDAALDTFVVDNAIENLKMSVGGVEVSRDVLAKLARRGLQYRDILAAMARDHQPEVLEAFVDIVQKEGAATLRSAFEDATRLTSIAKSVLAVLDGRFTEGAVETDVVPDEIDPKHVAIRVKIVTDGLSHYQVLDRNLLEQHEIEDLIQIRQEFADLGEGAFRLERGEEEVAEVGRVIDLVRHIGTVGRAGLNIQRYKGLGEMNPDQLWETTMDPDRRAFLQVRVGDAVEAANLFPVLMGENVEERRKFITDNALNARNLDV